MTQGGSRRDTSPCLRSRTTSEAAPEEERTRRAARFRYDAFGDNWTSFRELGRKTPIFCKRGRSGKPQTHRRKRTGGSRVHLQHVLLRRVHVVERVRRRRQREGAVAVVRHVLFHCPGRKPPFRAVKRSARHTNIQTAIKFFLLWKTLRPPKRPGRARTEPHLRLDPVLLDPSHELLRVLVLRRGAWT
jgi:hypothetical protein